MRGTRWAVVSRVVSRVVVAVGLGVLVLGGVGASAGEERGAKEGRDGDLRARVLATALEVMQGRIEARLGMGRTYEALGRHAEALAAYQGVDQVYREMQAEIQALLARIDAQPAASAPVRVRVRPPAPAAVPVPPAPAAPAVAPVPAGRPDAAAADRTAKEAVEAALRWLAAHQSPNGGWEAGGFERWCDGKPVGQDARLPDGRGKAGIYDPGVTGLALCAFLGAGHVPEGKSPYAQVVRRGLEYLRNVQDPEGCFGPRTTQHYVYNHAWASLAIVEAYGMTLSPRLREPAQKALDFIALARNPYFAWRYGIKPGDNDTSVTGAMAMVLQSAKLVNGAEEKDGKERPFAIDEQAFEGIRIWIDKMTDPDHGRVGYIQRGGLPARPMEMIDRFPADKSESMTAIGILARIFCGEDPRTSEPIRKGTALLLRRLPTWNPSDGSIDMYYWYYGTLATSQVGGDGWKAWSAALRTAVLGSQRTDGEPCGCAGSWDPLDPWGPDGGRVYSTALLALCAEVLQRYDAVAR